MRRLSCYDVVLVAQDHFGFVSDARADHVGRELPRGGVADVLADPHCAVSNKRLVLDAGLYSHLARCIVHI